MSQIQKPIDLAQRHQGWHDVRATVRYRCAPATYGRIFLEEQEGDQEFQRAWLADLSVNGIGLVMVRPIAAESPVHIVLRNPVSHQMVHIQATVAHATLQASGEWLMGCRFARPISDQELDELLS